MLIEGWEFEHCLKFLVMFLHGVGGIVEYEAKERVELVRRGKTKSTTWSLEYRNTLKFSTITVRGRRRKGGREGEAGKGGGRREGGGRIEEKGKGRVSGGTM